MSFILILKIIGIVLGVSSLSGIATWIIGRMRLKKSHREDLEKKDGTIKQLRTVITEMVELEGDKKDVDIQRNEIKKNIDSMSDDDLSIVYNNRLPDMPGKSKRNRKKP